MMSLLPKKKSSGLWLPDRKLEMPNLFEPWKNPQGAVEINEDNLFGFTPDNCRVAIGGHFTEVIAGEPLTYTIDSGMTGGRFYTGGDSQSAQFANCSFTDGAADGLTIWTRFKVVAGNSIGGIWGTPDDEQISLLQVSSNIIQWLVEDEGGNRYGRKTTETVVSGWNTLACTFNVGAGPTNKISIVLNGALTDSSTVWFDQVVSEIKDSAGTYSWSMGLKRTDSLDGEYTCMGIAALGLTDSQLLELEKDPYQFLVPK